MWIAQVIMATRDFHQQFTHNFRASHRSVMQPADNFQSIFWNNISTNGGCYQLLSFLRMKRFQFDVLKAHQQRPDAANIPWMLRPLLLRLSQSRDRISRSAWRKALSASKWYRPFLRQSASARSIILSSNCILSLTGKSVGLAIFFTVVFIVWVPKPNMDWVDNETIQS
jgi:hypothetical protein